MLSKLRSRKPSPAMAVALLALFVALGGSSYAALKVGSKQIVNNGVRSKDIRDNDVRSNDVRNGSLLAADFKAGQLPPGPRGPAGAQGASGATGLQGPRGLTGPTGPARTTTRTTSATLNLAARGAMPPAQSSAALTKSCNAGEFVTGGGGSANGDHTLAFSAPVPQTDGSTPTGWTIVVENRTASPSTAIDGVWVVCAPGP